MEYSVIIVEDEPTATQNLRDIIQIHCPAFRVIATAESGIEGVQLIQEKNPDLVLTDIRMPQMNGLEMLKTLREEHPGTNIIIVSGYPDFEYARTALKYGACDYLLKPITPSALRTALGKIQEQLEDDATTRRVQLIQDMIWNKDVDSAELQKYFPASAYVAELTRKNGLPRRFTHKRGNELYTGGSDLVDMYGRDEMESLYLCPAKDVQLESLTRTASEQLGQQEGYTTTIVYDRAFPIEEVPTVISQLYESLDRQLIIGRSQIIPIGTNYSPPPHPILDKAMRDEIEHYGKEYTPQQIKKYLDRLLTKWEQEKRPQLWVEAATRQLFDVYQNYAGAPDCEGDTGIMSEDAFFYATSYADLRESLFDILCKLTPEQCTADCKVDTPEFFTMVQDYVERHLAEPLSLQSVCRRFSISQTYLSRLFRKYTNQSFNNFLTVLRINRAKTLLLGENVRIKDVAAMVGYNDQFYFSRLFRSVTGTTPTDFMSAEPGV